MFCPLVKYPLTTPTTSPYNELVWDNRILEWELYLRAIVAVVIEVDVENNVLRRKRGLVVKGRKSDESERRTL